MFGAAPATAACLSLLSKFLSNSTKGATNECDALLLSYETACLHNPLVHGQDPLSNGDDDDDLTPDNPISVCCGEIKSAYNYRCNDRESGQLTDQRLMATVVVICLCLVVKEVLRRRKVTKLPAAAAHILVGMGCGYVTSFFRGYEWQFDEKLFLRVLLPPICFEAALSIDKESFRRHVGPILSFALLGTLISSFAAAAVFKYGSIMSETGELPWAESIAFGALISSIDPVAVLAVLNSLGVPPSTTLYISIFGESLLNDGVAVVLFDTVTDFFREDAIVTIHDLCSAALTFLIIFVGSSLVGFLSGLACTFYFRWANKTQTALGEVLLFFLFALVPYYLCDGLGWSGIVSIVVTGVMMDQYTMRHLSDPAKRHVRFVVETISTLTETSIFAYLGLFMFIAHYRWDGTLVLFSVLAMFASRALMLVIVSFVVNHLQLCRCGWRIRRRRQRRDSEEPDEGAGGRESISRHSMSSKDNEESPQFISQKIQFILWFAGLRGGMSFALVENVPLYDLITRTGSRYKPELRTCTSACIFLSIFLCGGMMHSLLTYLGVGGEEEASELTMSDVAGRGTDYSIMTDHDELEAAEVSLLSPDGLISDDGFKPDEGMGQRRVGSVRDDHFHLTKTTSSEELN